MIRTLRLEAPAKINLYLEVRGRRPDGYHEIRTVMHSLELADVLTFRPSDSGFRLTCGHPQVPLGEENLVTRAVLLLARRLRREPDFSIHLQKKIPVAAGLGGGSSDAAAALLGAARLWNCRDPKLLLRLAKQLGSDVPFLLRGGCGYGTGRGEKIFAWPAVPGAWILLVNPGFPVSTAEVYKKASLELTTPSSHINMMRIFIKNRNILEIGRNLKNHLEAVTETMHPVIGRIKRDLRSCGAVAVQMSGSGPTVFGLLPSRAAGERAKIALHSRYPQVILTRTAEPREAV